MRRRGRTSLGIFSLLLGAALVVGACVMGLSPNATKTLLTAVIKANR